MKARRSVDLRFRSAKEDDLDRLVEIHLAAYPDALSVAARQRNFTLNPFGNLDDLIVVERRGELVAHAFLHPLRASFGGAWVKVGGVASVGVALEARGQGIATALMHHLHGLSDRRRDAITLLYAFRQGFYAGIGYSPTSSRKRLGIDPRSVPPSWRSLARDRVTALRPTDERSLRRLHTRAAERSSGWIRRSKRYWEMLRLRESRMTLVCRSADHRRATGYVAFTLSQDEAHGPTVLEVDEMVFDDAESRRALFGALSAMRDQVGEIVIEIAETDPLERALLDSDARRPGTVAVEHPIGELVGGPMIRITDVARAIRARGYGGSGAFDVVVRAEESADAFHVVVRDGRGVVEPLPRKRAREPRALVTSRSGLAALLYGGLLPSDAVALGLAEASPELAAALQPILRIAPVTPIDAF